jgi:hypothetical protein
MIFLYKKSLAGGDFLANTGQSNEHWVSETCFVLEVQLQGISK